jgi:cytochrome c-type biogenesis protein CcmH
MKQLLFAALMGLLPLTAWAGEAKELADDPVVEKRMVALASKLRCMQCQNESLASSHAPLAEDLRREVREQIRAGKSDEEILKYLTDRYGDFVLYDPPLKDYTLLLWGGPFLLILGGAGVLFYQLRRRRKTVPEATLSAEAHQRAAALLKDEEKQ